MDELRTLYNQLKQEEATILATSAPVRAERDALQEDIAPLLAQDKALADQIRSIEQPRLAEVRNMLGPLAVALGGKSLPTDQPE